MDKGKKRRISWLAVAIVLMLVNVLFIFISVPIIMIVIIDYLLTSTKTIKEEEYEVPIEEDNNVDKLRACVEKVDNKNEYEKEIRKKVDLREFKGRKDVTKEEVARYLWYHKIWEGRREKEIICEEIAKVSNINEEDINWIMHEHYNHEGKDGKVGGGYWDRNDEAKREIEYRRKKVREKDKEFKKDFERHNIKESKNEEYKYIFYYDDWLKEKGYV